MTNLLTGIGSLAAMLALSPALAWAGVYAQWGIMADLTPSTCPGRTSTDSFLRYYWRVNPGAGTDYWIVDSGYGLGLGIEGGVCYNYWVRPLTEHCAAEFGDPVAYECPAVK